jgi:patatin-like phospholipase/acyl hydrolase
MQKISDNHGGMDVKPCEYFDLIAGSSTGGLIAIMLGRLGYTVDECIEKFKGLARTVFTHPTRRRLIFRSSWKYAGSTLEDAIKEFIDRDNMMRPGDSDPHHCFTFVVAHDVKRQPVIIRTYPIRDASDFSQRTSSLHIWEACRATSAAPTYFPSFHMGQDEFLDGGLRDNNPVRLALKEARHLTSSSRPVECLVSIGTGSASNQALRVSHKFSTSITRSLHIDMMFTVMDTEKAHQHLGKIAKQSSIKYFRFNSPGANRVALDEYNKMEKFENLVDNYLRRERIQSDIQACANILSPYELTSDANDDQSSGQLLQDSLCERLYEKIYRFAKQGAARRLQKKFGGQDVK